jgi:hypothetical protein
MFRLLFRGSWCRVSAVFERSEDRHALQWGCRHPCARPCTRSRGKFISGFQSLHEGQTLPSTPPRISIFIAAVKSTGCLYRGQGCVLYCVLYESRHLHQDEYLPEPPRPTSQKQHVRFGRGAFAVTERSGRYAFRIARQCRDIRGAPDGRTKPSPGGLGEVLLTAAAGFGTVRR